MPMVQELVQQLTDQKCDNQAREDDSRLYVGKCNTVIREGAAALF